MGYLIVDFQQMDEQADLVAGPTLHVPPQYHSNDFLMEGWCHGQLQLFAVLLAQDTYYRGHVVDKMSQPLLKGAFYVAPFHQRITSDYD